MTRHRVKLCASSLSKRKGEIDRSRGSADDKDHNRNLVHLAGLLIGVSFVATPAKFLAPSLALAQALDVGRWTFYVLAWIEWGFVSVVAALLVTTRQPGNGYMRLLIFNAVVLVTTILAAESFALRPMLDARVLRIMAGESVSPSPWHNVYVGLEGLKALLLLVAGSFTMQWQRDANST